MNIDKEKIIKSAVIIVALFAGVFALTQFSKSNSVSLKEYAEQHPELHTGKEPETEATDDGTDESAHSETEDTETQEAVVEETPPVSTLMGATLNGDEMLEYRFTYADSFYYEPLSDNLRRYITGISFPATEEGTEADLAISYDDLRYVHILHYDFEGNPVEGELICNEYIACLQQGKLTFYKIVTA